MEKSISRQKILNTARKKEEEKKWYAMWIHHLLTFHFSKCVHIPHFIIDNYWRNANNSVYALSKFIQAYRQVNSSSSDHQQKKPNRKTCIQNKERRPEYGCMKVSSGWKCFYWVMEVMEEFFLFSCWFPPLMIPLLNHSWMHSTQYKWVIAKTSIKMLQ